MPKNCYTTVFMHFYVGYDSLQSCSVCAWYTVITVSVWLTLSLGVRIRIKFNVRKLLFTGQSGTQWSKRPWLKGDGTDGTRGSQWKQLDGSDADRRNRRNTRNVIRRLKRYPQCTNVSNTIRVATEINSIVGVKTRKLYSRRL